MTRDLNWYTRKYLLLNRKEGSNQIIEEQNRHKTEINDKIVVNPIS